MRAPDLDHEILAQLRTANAAKGWRKFLEDFSPVLLNIVCQNVRGQDERSDCFIEICEKLSEDQFHRLLSFNPSGTAQFKTWLTVVVSRLCIDWLRRTYGRDRPFANVQRMPPLEQRLFHFRHEVGLDRNETIRAIQTESPDIEAVELQAALARLQHALTPDQRWRLAMRNHVELPIDDVEETTNGETLDDGVANAEAEDRLATSLARIDPQDRLLLQYRFEHDLTFDQIAKVTGMSDQFRARRAVEQALARLRAAFSPN
jgi:RNA polymerase sigma factor (sigma-70 family)